MVWFQPKKKGDLHEPTVHLTAQGGNLHTGAVGGVGFMGSGKKGRVSRQGVCAETSPTNRDQPPNLQKKNKDPQNPQKKKGQGVGKKI